MCFFIESFPPTVATSSQSGFVFYIVYFVSSIKFPSGPIVEIDRRSASLFNIILSYVLSPEIEEV